MLDIRGLRGGFYRVHDITMDSDIERAASNEKYAGHSRALISSEERKVHFRVTVSLESVLNVPNHRRGRRLRSMRRRRSREPAITGTLRRSPGTLIDTPDENSHSTRTPDERNSRLIADHDRAPCSYVMTR